MVKLIWNFYGPDAKGTAAHHRIHLEAFAANNNIDVMKYKTGLENIDESHSMCFIEADKDIADKFDVLRPHEKVNE